MLTIIFDQDFPQEVRPSIERYMEKFGRFVPQWLAELRFRWDEDNTDDFASITVRMDYRRATMKIAPGFLGIADDHRQSTFLHEIAHLYNTPLYTVGMDVLALLCPDKEESDDPVTVQLYKTLRERLREMVETCNSDLTYTFDRLLDDMVVYPEPTPANVIPFTPNRRKPITMSNSLGADGHIRTKVHLTDADRL